MLRDCMITMGCAKARNGAALCFGNLLGCGAKKIHRTCMSSLSAEIISLSNVCDLSVWTRAVCLGILVGGMFQDLALPNILYKLVTPFGAPPVASQISDEIHNRTAEKNRLGEVDEHEEQTARRRDIQTLFQPNGRFNLINLLETLILTDSANAYPSVLPGNPNVSDRQTRIALSAVRDLAETTVLSFVGKNCNLADVRAKSERSNLDILLAFLKKGRFTIGFPGGEEATKRIRIQKENDGKGSV